MEDRVEFRVENFFGATMTDASVVTLYLRHHINLDLLPHLLSQLRSGTRLISHSFDMGEWEPQKVVTVETKLLFLWTVP